MTKRRHDDDFYASSGGRQRGEYKKPEEKLAEDKAKGHLREPAEEQPGEELEGSDRSRGNQHGYGKNQGAEPKDSKKTPWSNHSIGGFDHWNSSVGGAKNLPNRP
jgi:hypothetical protein